MWRSQASEFGNGICGFGPMFGNGIFGWIIFLLFWGVVLYLGATIIRKIFIRDNVGQDDTALNTLRNRFAAGEISEQEFTDQKKILSK